jgi:BioD-like phosphotransacetylase family protein
MPTILIASLQPGEGRTATTAGLGACLADEGRTVRLLRIRAAEGADSAAKDDARALAAVPGCASPRGAVSEQEAQVQASEAEAAGAFCLIEAQPGVPTELVAQLSGRVVLVSVQMNDLRVGDLVSAAETLGDALLGVVVTRQPERRLPAVQAALRERGLTCLAAIEEDRLLAGPTVHEMAEALHASRLVETGEEDEAVEFVMLGPISADPGQPYFLQHGSKAVVNRFDKMDLHLAALATEPDCLILTGGRPPSPYLLDRVEGSEVTVLLSPEDTVRTVELLDDLYGRTRFSGRRKLSRAFELFRGRLNLQELTEALR